MKIWSISDTHGVHNNVIIPEADIMIYAGDSTNSKSILYNQIEFDSFATWLINIPIKYKIIIAGNHDTWAYYGYNKELLQDNGIIYLEHDSVNIEGINIFGSPYTKMFGDWNFMIKTEYAAELLWSLIPDDTDILVTHGPPYGILDRVPEEHCGDKYLLNKINAVKPKHVIFGHIHNLKENSGAVYQDDVWFHNVSSVIDDFKFRITSHGQIIDYEI